MWTANVKCDLSVKDCREVSLPDTWDTDSPTVTKTPGRTVSWRFVKEGRSFKKTRWTWVVCIGYRFHVRVLIEIKEAKTGSKCFLKDPLSQIIEPKEVVSPFYSSFEDEVHKSCLKSAGWKVNSQINFDDMRAKTSASSSPLPFNPMWTLVMTPGPRC